MGWRKCRTGCKVREVKVMGLDEAYGVKKRTYHWPYTGTGFISTKNGEILPEYYLSKGFEDMKNFNIGGIKIVTADGEIYILNW